MLIPSHKGNPICPCQACLNGKVAFWKAFLGKPISEEDMDSLFSEGFSSYMFSAPVITKMGPLRISGDGVFGWGPDDNGLD